MATRPSIKVRFQSPSNPAVTVLMSSSVMTGCSWSYGRQRLTDSFQGNSCQVYGIKPTDVTAWPEIGTAMSVEVIDRTNANYNAWFVGACSNVEIQYGLIPALDTFTITIESPLSRLGRQIATLTTTAGASASAAVTSLDALTPLDVLSNNSTYPFASTTSAQTIEQTITDHINLLARGEQAYVLESGLETQPADDAMEVTLLSSRTPYSFNTYTFSDTGAASPTVYRYNQLVFQSLADNYSTKVLVNATGFAQQDAGTGTFTLELDTINGSASEADNLAGYVKTILDLNQRTPTSIRFDGAGTDAGIITARMGQNYSGAQITFRGTTYYTLIEGASFSANASNWECELYLSSASYRPFLQLNSTASGILNTNKLGF